MTIGSDRRDFIRGFGALAAIAAAGCRCPFCGGERKRIALQLWSIHDILWQRTEEVFTALRAAGYDGVEFYDFNGMSAKEVRRLLADTGLAGAGVHVNGDVALVGDKLKETLDFCVEAGIESVTTPHASRKTADEYRAFGHQMGLAAETAAAWGIPVGIHTTYHHFTTKYDGVTAWDVMFSDASPRLQQQVDLGNAFHTGTDVVALLKKYPNRHFSIHAKENEPTEDGVFGVPPTDGGKCVPWNDVLGYMATEKNQKWWIVEAELKPASLDPAKKCCAILRDWLA